MQFSLNHHPSRWPAFLAGAISGAAAGIVVAGNFFTEGKKITQSIEAPYAVGDDAFVRAMNYLLGPPMVDGNRVTALHNGVQIFPAMLDAIEGAERTICFENFVWSQGRIARRFADALSRKARQGVKVHLLQDAIGCDDVRNPEFAMMRDAGVELEIYRFLHLTRINQRTHRKLLIVDGKVGFTGGVGIGDLWDGNGRSKEEWRDSHFRLEGPAVAQMQQAFMDNWMQTRACILHGDDYFPELKSVGDDLCQVFKSSADEGSDSARIMFLLSIAAARKSIQIANAYFIPDGLTIETLVKARDRGVKVEIITPGPLIDQSWVRLISRKRIQPLLEAGVQCYEFQPSNFHCKYMTIDGCWCSVGSTNLDNRSLRFNEETNLNVLDKEFASELAATFEQDKSDSCRITMDDWRRRSFSERATASACSLFRRQL